VDEWTSGCGAPRGCAPAAARPARRKLWVIGSVVAVALVVAGLTWTSWPDSPPDPRAWVYTQATACLLTPAGGVVAEQVAPVWAGMQQASLATHGKVQYLEVDGPQTADNAKTFLATVINGKCDLVLTTGAAPNAALLAVAGSYLDSRFLLIGKAAPQVNVAVVDEMDAAQVTERVRAAVTQALPD
jgi:hypothetical protein